MIPSAGSFTQWLLGMAFGSWISWWLNRPWLEFMSLMATYELEAHEIKLYGYYQVNRECKAEPAGAVWRNEALATDGQIAMYGPRPEAPPMFKGEHRLAMSIPLEERILPDGWKVTAEAYCAGESPETVVSSGRARRRPRP